MIALLAWICLFSLLGAAGAIASPNLYVSMGISAGGAGVEVIDAADNSVRYVLPTGVSPSRATLNADHTRLYVLDFTEWTLTVLDTRSRVVLETVTLMGPPLAIGIPKDDAHVYVGLERLYSGEIGSVQAIDTRLGQADLAATVPDGFFMEVSADGTTLYLEDHAHCSLIALDTDDFSQKAAGATFCDNEDAAIVSPDGATLYVNALSGGIDAFDAATLDMRFRIAMPWAGGDMGAPMAFTRDGSGLVVGDAANGLVAFVDAARGVLETTTYSCPGATGIAFSADERFVYVLCISSFEGAVLDAHTHALLRVFPAGAYPSSYRNFVGDPPVPLYVAEGSESGDVVALDSLSHALGPPSRVGRQPEGIVASQDGHRLYVSNGGDDTVSIVDADTRSEIATIAVGRYPTGLALSPDGTRLYVADTDDDSISIVDTGSRAVVSTFAVDADSKPRSLALSADGSKLYVALSNWNYIVVYDTAAGVLGAPIYCPSGISGLAMSPDGTTLYGAARFNAEVYKVDVASDTVVDTWSVGIDIEGSAHPMTVSPDGGRLYVGRASSEVPPEADAFVITVDTGDGSELAWTTLAGTPASLAVEPEGRFVYAAIPGADSVQVVDTTTSEVDRTIGGFHSPAAIAPPVEPIMDGLFGSGFD